MNTIYVKSTEANLCGVITGLDVLDMELPAGWIEITSVEYQRLKARSIGSVLHGSIRIGETPESARA